MLHLLARFTSYVNVKMGNPSQFDVYVDRKRKGNTYDIEHFKTHDPVKLEIHYGGQSFAGEKLDIEKMATEDGDLFRIVRDGNEITSCRIAWAE